MDDERALPNGPAAEPTTRQAGKLAARLKYALRLIVEYFLHLRQDFDSELYGRSEAVAFYVVAGLMTVPLALGIVRFWSWDEVLKVNLVFVFLGCLLRLVSHGQKKSWALLDAMGKVVALYAAMLALIAGNFG